MDDATQTPTAQQINAANPLGVDGFGQSGDIDDLYRIHGIDRDAILNACAAACLNR